MEVFGFKVSDAGDYLMRAIPSRRTVAYAIGIAANDMLVGFMRDVTPGVVPRPIREAILRTGEYHFTRAAEEATPL